MSNQEKHDFVPCTCEDCFGRDDACCAYCHSRKSDPIHTPAEAQKPPCRCEQPYEAHANLPLRSRKRDGRKVTCYIYQPAEAQAETTLSQPNLEPGWLSQAISAPERPLEEVVKGAYNPYNSEAQAVKPAPENGEYSILGYDGERQSPTSSAPSAPEGSQVGKPISEERLKEAIGVLVYAKSDVAQVCLAACRELLALRTENASLLAAVNRSNELDREAAEKIVALEKQAERANRDLAAMTEDRNLYRDEHAGDCPFAAQLEQAKRRICRLEGWLTEKTNNESSLEHEVEDLKQQLAASQQADSARKVQNG